jgi:hypothetical protein
MALAAAASSGLSSRVLAGVRRSRHGIDVRVIGESGMRVMIERRNLLDLREQPLVNLLEIGSGKWTGLSGCENREAGHQEKRPAYECRN